MQLKKIQLILSFFLFIPYFLKSQPDRILNPKQETIQFLHLADSLQFDDTRQSIAMAMNALNLAEKNDFDSVTTAAYLFLGNAYSLIQDYSTANQYYELVLIKAQNNQDKNLELKVQFGRSSILRRKGEYAKSIEPLRKAEKLAQQLRDKKQVGNINSNIARIHYIYGDMEKAIEFLNIAKNLFEEIKDDQALSALYNNLGILYKENQQTEQAKVVFKEALRTSILLKDGAGTISTYGNLGFLSILENELDIAENYLLKGFHLANELGMENPAIYNNLGKLYLKKNNLQLAENYAISALKLHDKQGRKNEIMQDKELLSKIYFLQKKHKKAYQFQMEFEALEDELFKADKSKELELIENKYKLQQQELEIIALDKESQKRHYLLIGLGIFAGMLLVVGLLLFRQRNLKNKEEKILLKQKLLLSQMNPHFIFNALSVIQNFIFKNDAKAAGKYLAKFAKLIRMILENSRKDYIPLEEEIQAIEYYLDLQRLRFQNQFDYKIQISKQVIPEQISIAPMLTQPFIENAIEHGIRLLEDKGFLEIDFNIKDDSLYFTLKDNGIGRAKAKAVQVGENFHKSLSTQITKERLMNYQHRKETPFQLEISDILNKNGAVVGTKICIQIPTIRR